MVLLTIPFNKLPWLQSSNSNSFSGSGITNNGHHLGGKNRQIDLEMIYEVDDMIDDSSGRGKDTKLSGIVLALFVSFWWYCCGAFWAGKITIDDGIGRGKVNPYAWASKLNRGLSVFDLFVGPCGLDDTLDNFLTIFLMIFEIFWPWALWQ